MKMVSSGRPSWPYARDQLARQHRADGAVDVADRLLDELHLLAALERRAAHFSIRRDVERLREAVVLRLARGGAPRRPASSAGGRCGVKSRPCAFQCAMPFFVSSRSARPISSSKLADAELRHDLARFLGDEEEVVDDVLGLARELACAAPGPASPRRPGRC